MAVTKVNYGHPPTLTIGEAVAEDAKIVFDGNAQDYHIGLDDSADDLVIGLGSALGTTTHMAFDETGAIIKPLQPGFSAIPSAQVNNLAADATHDLAFATEIWDTNADFATPSFTAPVTGKYLFVWTVQVYYIAADADFYEVSLVTSNRNYRQQMDPDFGQNNVFWDFHGTAIADMDTSDTAKVTLLQDDGTAMTDYTVLSRFAGYLLG